MNLGADMEPSILVGRDLNRMVPQAFVKMPFTPQYPHCFLIARNLEREGIPVNFTSTVSARQAVAAALLSDVTRTHIFMSRLNGGLNATLLGQHVDLEAKGNLRRLRREDGVKTKLIFAGVNNWETFIRTAGCDVYTAPPSVVADLLSQTDVGPDGMAGKLETSYASDLRVSEDTLEVLPMDRIARLWQVESELVGLLREYRGTAEYREMTDGDAQSSRFDKEGLRDPFYSPSRDEWAELRTSNLSRLETELPKLVAIDTLYSLLADAGFVNHQDEIDGKIRAAV